MPDGQYQSSSSTADKVQAEVARLLTTPGALESDPEGQLFHDERQKAQLRLFRGFITKVMHNGIRKFIPKTLRLLSALKIELSFFLAVSPSFQRLRSKGSIPPDSHLAWFEQALTEWATDTNHLGAALAKDIFVHEMVLHQARQPQPAKCEPKKAGALWLEGSVVLRRYQFDVLSVLRELDTKRVNPAEHEAEEPIIICYWLDRAGEHVVTQLDELTARVIALVDGKRSYLDIADKFVENGIPGVDAGLVQEVCKPLLANTPLKLAGHAE